ncbi:SPOR domain-containing protein, partial [candidate division WOR-3 bacterium]|nr:SPOR domain-containing protein [candidate division WOR-3 bacterium]
LFTIQVSSSKNKRSAEQLIERLLTAGYPAYLVGSDGWFKVRVGAFKQKDYALLISEKVDEVIKEKSWVLESEIHLSEISSPLIRDLSGNGYMEEACMRDGKDIVIFEIRNGMYNVIHTITGYLEKYTGYPSFYDIDGDGNLEIVTPTLQGGLYSVVRYRNGEWIEEMKRYE